MKELAVDSICAAASGEEKTEKSSSFLVEEIGGSVANVQIGLAASKGGFFFFFSGF